LGEYKTGDIPWGAPNKDHVAEDVARLDMGMCFNPPDPRLKFLDMLDAYLWMRLNARHLEMQTEWGVQRARLIRMADELKVDLSKVGMFH
jgi:hypothetical protein